MNITIAELEQALAAFDKIDLTKLGADISTASDNPQALIADAITIAPMVGNALTAVDPTLGAKTDAGIEVAEKLLSLVQAFAPGGTFAPAPSSKPTGIV